MRCPSCGGEKWRNGTVPQAIEIEGRTFKASLAATVCTKCGDPIVSHDELGRFEIAVANELARAGTSSGQAIKFMRKAISLPAAELAALLGVQRWTVSRWETGERGAPIAAVATLGALVLLPRTLGCPADRAFHCIQDGGTRGWILHASVVSGHAVDMLPAGEITFLGGGRKGFARPEHYIEIMGYKDDVFMFWDPDASTSFRHGGGFGYLYIDPDSGRLWTADLIGTNKAPAPRASNPDFHIDYHRVQGKDQHIYQVMKIDSR